MAERFKGSPNEYAAYKAGQIDQRLDNHDEHLRTLNGSLAKQADAQEKLLTVVTALVARFGLAAKIGLLFLTAWVTAITYLLVHAG